MSRRVVADSGPFITLERSLIGFRLLRLFYDQVLIPQAVLEELEVKVPDYLATQGLWDLVRVEDIGIGPDFLHRLDRGERYAIALAKARGLPLLAEDQLAREEARELSIPVRGTIYLITRAHRERLLSEDEAADNLQAMFDGYQINRKLFREALAKIRSDRDSE